ncbi:hypothetical protein KM915_03610 [Cytobacillus oceanisediminis]|uniref:hypothetical protein n=1 Tax=Cytobacillus oceanisediminis TaxID=665099 RepID=UPI001C2222A1|nr:hypothetical protein [Cytobacillus oceanisediminis]MBU8729142.1 hypothetical protein [Cytobacillus oceanisediminis]
MASDAVINPVFSMEEVNQPIKIYNGDFTLEIEDDKFTLHGDISLKWLPEPKISFTGKIISGDEYFESSKVRKSKIKITTPNGYKGFVMINQINHMYDYKVTGVVLDSIQRLNEGMNSLYFSVVNFVDNLGDGIVQEKRHYLGRLNFKYGDYIITFDKLPNYSEYYDALNDTGGYIITHVGVLKNSNGEFFRIEEVENLLECLSWLLSFASGRQVAICSLHGFDNNDELVFERYQTPIISKWKNIQNWFPRNKGNALESIYPMLVKKMNDDLWATVLKRVFTWYFDSNNSTYIENKIVAVQIALEMLAWTFIVEENEIIDSKIFDSKLRASDKLRLLLYELSIPKELPDIEDFKMLKSSYKDGAHLFTDFRNDIVHSKKTNKKEEKIPKLTKHFILQLGKQYLELSVLRILSYKGEYHNLLSKKDWIGETVEHVPWNNN